MRYTLVQALGLASGEDDDGHSTGSGDGGPISEEQAATIRAMIEATETDIQKFCAYLKVNSIPEIAASQFGRVIAMLEKKKGAK